MFRPEEMRSPFHPLEQMPQIGEKMYVPENVSGEYEYLVCVGIQEDFELSNTINKKVFHVYFASPEDNDNPYQLPNGVKYYTIRTFC